MNLFDRFKIFVLKILLKVLGLLFNRTKEIEQRLTEVNEMHTQGRVVDDSFLSEKVSHSFYQITKKTPNDQQLQHLTNKAQKAISQTGYYPSAKQMELFILDSLTTLPSKSEEDLK